MGDDDFAWAAELMARRRERYSRYSPVFWRPAAGATESHGNFMRSAAARDSAVALRTTRGFALAYPSDGRIFVDDFAVEADALWMTEGCELLGAVWERTRSKDHPLLRVVTARADHSKREMLASLGLVVTSRWWVKELRPTGDVSESGPVRLGDVEALMVPAPPVYDPGGPVCLLGDLDASLAGSASDAAARRGAVLAIVQRDRSPSTAPDAEPELEAAGFHNPSEFFDGALR
jgi:hypothetical protein